MGLDIRVYGNGLSVSVLPRILYLLLSMVLFQVSCTYNFTEDSECKKFGLKLLDHLFDNVSVERLIKPLLKFHE